MPIRTLLAAVGVAALSATPIAMAQESALAEAQAERAAQLALAVEGEGSANASRTDAWLQTLAQASKTWTRHLPANPDELLLQGEHAVRKVPIYFSNEDAGRATELRVATISAVSALPEASSVSVHLNGTRVGTVRPNASGPARISVPLQPGQLVEGFNELMFVATHQHRIDCSVEGTYELWTRIIADATGISGTRGDDGSPAVASMPAVLGRNAAPSTLRVTLPATPDEASATRIGRFVNTVVLNGWIANPTVVADAKQGAPGVALKVLSEVPRVGANGATIQPFADAETMFVERSATGETTALILAGAPVALDRELDRLEAKARVRSPKGSREGLAALVSSFGGELDDAGQMSFASLGIESVNFVGRRYKLDIPALLPGDYYQAAYGSVLIYLDGSYAANLMQDSVLAVKVNGVETATLPLDGRATTFNSKEVRVPLSYFHAGMNTLTLEADLRTEADLACAPESAAVRTPRFMLSNTSRIVIPTMARVGVVPNLAATLSHGYPYTLDAAPTDVFVTGARRSGLASALSLFAEITANAQQLERFEVAFRPPTEDESGIIIGPAGTLPVWAREMIGEEVETDPEPADADEEDEVVSEAPPAVRDRVLLAEADGDTMTDVQPLRQRLGPQLDVADNGDLVGSVSERVTGAIDWLRDGSNDKLAQLREEAGDVLDMVLNRSEEVQGERAYRADDVVFAQDAFTDAKGVGAVAAAVMPHAPPRTWTVIATEEAGALNGAFDGIAPQGVAFNPSGQHYVFSEARDRMIETGEAGLLYATRSPQVGNLRLILAGWLSTNVQTYLYIIVSSVFLLGLLTYLAVRRRREERAS